MGNIAAVWQEGKLIIFPKKSDIAVRGGILFEGSAAAATLAAFAVLWWLLWRWWAVWWLPGGWLLILLMPPMPPPRPPRLPALIPGLPAEDGSRKSEEQLPKPRLEKERESVW